MEAVNIGDSKSNGDLKIASTCLCLPCILFFKAMILHLTRYILICILPIKFTHQKMSGR